MQGVYDTLNLSYTLEISVYQLVTYKKCKMAVKLNAFFYKWADGEWANYSIRIDENALQVLRDEKIQGQQICMIVACAIGMQQ